MPAIRAAKEWGKRPTAVIAQDDWYGHRDLNGFPQDDKDEWVEWDHALVQAYQTVQDYSDDNGLLRWETDAEYVEVAAVKKIDKFRAAIEQRTKGGKDKPYKGAPGEYFVPEMYSRMTDGEGNEVFPRFSEWIMSSVAESPEFITEDD